jgi:hypothetical protein
VQCDVSPDALRDRAFDILLAENGITWEAASGEPAAPADKPTGSGAARKDADRRLAGAADGPTGAQGGGQSAPQSGARELDLVQQDGGALDLVYVEATGAQIEATLAGLAAQSDNFLSVVVEPAPEVAAQQDLARYNRRGANRAAQPQVDSLSEPGAEYRRAKTKVGRESPPGRARRLPVPGSGLKAQHEPAAPDLSSGRGGAGFGGEYGVQQARPELGPAMSSTPAPPGEHASKSLAPESPPAQMFPAEMPPAETPALPGGMPKRPEVRGGPRPSAAPAFQPFGGAPPAEPADDAQSATEGEPEALRQSEALGRQMPAQLPPPGPAPLAQEPAPAEAVLGPGRGIEKAEEPEEAEKPEEAEEQLPSREPDRSETLATYRVLFVLRAVGPGAPQAAAAVAAEEAAEARSSRAMQADDAAAPAAAPPAADVAPAAEPALK